MWGGPTFGISLKKPAGRVKKGKKEMGGRSGNFKEREFPSWAFNEKKRENGPYNEGPEKEEGGMGGFFLVWGVCVKKMV